MKDKQDLVFFDLDGTISKRDTYKEILLFGLFYRPGRLAYASLSFYDYVMFRFGCYSNTIVKERLLCRIFGGVEKGTLRKIVASYIDYFLKNNLKAGAVNRIKYHKDKGDYIVLLTASFDFYVLEIGDVLGFDQVICTIAKKNKKGLTGEIDGENCHSKNKIKGVKKHIEIEQFKSTTCYTDHHSDVPLIKFCDTAYFVDPTDKLRKNSEFNNIDILRW